jgi:hypothetical protein
VTNMQHELTWFTGGEEKRGKEGGEGLRAGDATRAAAGSRSRSRRRRRKSSGRLRAAGAGCGVG